MEKTTKPYQLTYELLPSPKADFFRLLVLYKDGGIYADADVHLEINLATFLTPNLSFFVPRETIRDLAGKDYCLWNGLLGAAPGHPIIAKAIERMLELISTKADYYDVERRTCIASGNSASVWKLRSLPTLLLSGPCALGMAVNEAIGKEDLLANFEPGWLAPLPESVTRGREIGDALILLVSLFLLHCSGCEHICSSRLTIVLALVHVG